ncbi:MAG: hypothetical protein GY943_12130, partial [Chloroflexi bacterium]|nr:hypothetical protein [Chloroflexota bacterium]
MWDKPLSVSASIMQRFARYLHISTGKTAARYLLFFLGICLLLSQPPAIITAQQTISFEDYLALISRSRSSTQNATSQDGAACNATLNQIADEISGFTHVRLPNGSTMRVDHDGLNAVLQSSSCNTSGMTTYLAGICPAYLCPISRSSPAQSSTAPPLPTESNGQTGGNPADNNQFVQVESEGEPSPFENTAPIPADASQLSGDSLTTPELATEGSAPTDISTDAETGASADGAPPSSAQDAGSTANDTSATGETNATGEDSTTSESDPGTPTENGEGNPSEQPGTTEGDATASDGTTTNGEPEIEGESTSAEGATTEGNVATEGSAPGEGETAVSDTPPQPNTPTNPDGSPIDDATVGE